MKGVNHVTNTFVVGSSLHKKSHQLYSFIVLLTNMHLFLTGGAIMSGIGFTYTNKIVVDNGGVFVMAWYNNLHINMASSNCDVLSS